VAAILVLYIPSWSGVCGAVLIQGCLLGALAAALFAYTAPRHGKTPSSLFLTLGLVAGLLVGLGLELWSWSAGAPSPGFTRGRALQWGVMAFFELWRSAIFAASGLLIGWAALQCYVLTARWKSMGRHRAV
jgi:hypothetical protein